MIKLILLILLIKTILIILSWEWIAAFICFVKEMYE